MAHIFFIIIFALSRCRKSEVNIIDAKTMSPEPVAVVELPARVPYGFHAFFVNEVSSNTVPGKQIMK